MYNWSPVLNSRRHKKHVRQPRWNTLLSRDLLTNSDGEMPWPQPVHFVPYRLRGKYREQFQRIPKEMTFTSPKTKQTYLKKSFLQNNFDSRLKHFSANCCRQSQHRTHVTCHLRSDTLSRNLSKIGSLQPAQWSLTPTVDSARPVNRIVLQPPPPVLAERHIQLEYIALHNSSNNGDGNAHTPCVCMCKS